MRKALIIGVDHYPYVGNLTGCVNDAHSVKAMLERHADGSINFPTPKLMTSSGPASLVTKAEIKDAARKLFEDASDIALFYFAGHGFIEDTGGYLCGSDSVSGDDGFSLQDLMTFVNTSDAKNKIIILDSCHSGAAAAKPIMPGIAEIKEGVTVLTASSPTQAAMEVPGGGAGVFTSLLIDALGGAAANLLGHVTPGSIYAHVDQSLGPWGQRPLFKTNVRSFISLRQADAPIALNELQDLAKHFPTAGHLIQLNPTFEPHRSQEDRDNPAIPAPVAANTATFAVLQNYVKVNLVRPVDAPHMWHAAMQSKSCKMTVLGEHYRYLVEKGLI